MLETLIGTTNNSNIQSQDTKSREEESREIWSSVKTELVGEIKRLEVPKFNGKGGGEAAEAWLNQMETYFP